MELPLRFRLIMKLFKKKKIEQVWIQVCGLDLLWNLLQISDIIAFIITLFNSFVIRFCSVQFRVEADRYIFFAFLQFTDLFSEWIA